MYKYNVDLLECCLVGLSPGRDSGILRTRFVEPRRSGPGAFLVVPRRLPCSPQCLDAPIGGKGQRDTSASPPHRGQGSALVCL